MDKRASWITTRVTLGWVFLVAGVIVAFVGILFEVSFSYAPFNFRLITGLGILLTGIGVGFLIRYRSALKDEQSARRLTVEERDERTVMIRNRAGNRAYIVSTALVYTGLIWTSFAVNDSLPPLAGDGLWFFLAICVVIPFGVYVGSILIDQQKN
jgi:hypothetical protein